MKNLNYIFVCGLLSIVLTLAGCMSNQSKENTVTPSSISTPVSMTTAPTQSITEKSKEDKGNIITSENNNATDYDFTTWNEKKLYDFMNEVKEYTNQVAMKTYITKEEIIPKYQTYFSQQLSEKIVNGLFVKTDDGWKVPAGDTYVFTVPEKGENVMLEVQKKFITLKATYEIGIYSLIQYTIQYDSKPIITEWINK
jgi:hypothetical protein